ncbi:MAG: hypothetical protein WHT06_13425 [Desulfobacterales bacterium]
MDNRRPDSSRISPAGAASASRDRWTVLLVGSHGRVITLPRFRLLFGFAAVLLTSAFLAAAGLGLLAFRLETQRRDLAERLEAAQGRLDTLMRDRERLAAELVLAQARLREIAPSSQGGEAETAAAESPAPEASPKADAAVPLAAEPPPPIRPAVSVQVESFAARFDAAASSLEIRYRLAVSGSVRRPVEGHVIVVFKGEDADPGSWISMPPVPLPRGRPSGNDKGYRFAIGHAKEFTQRLRLPAAPEGVGEALVYVFAADGQLLTARQYEVRP